LAIKGQLLPKMFNFIVNLVIFIIVASLIFFIMTFLHININVELTYKPIYKPLTSQMLAISIAQSDINKAIWDYLDGKTDGKEIENSIAKIISQYKISIDTKVLGNKNLIGEAESLTILGAKNRKIEIKVIA